MVVVNQYLTRFFARKKGEWRLRNDDSLYTCWILRFPRMLGNPANQSSDASYVS